MRRDLEDVFSGEGMRCNEACHYHVVELRAVVRVDYVRTGRAAGLV
jgi:hypothetical protein